MDGTFMCRPGHPLADLPKVGFKSLAAYPVASTPLSDELARIPMTGAVESLNASAAAAVAIYPMYRGIARLLGMDVLGFDPEQTFEVPTGVLEHTGGGSKVDPSGLSNCAAWARTWATAWPHAAPTAPRRPVARPRCSSS